MIGEFNSHADIIDQIDLEHVAFEIEAAIEKFKRHPQYKEKWLSMFLQSAPSNNDCLFPDIYVNPQFDKDGKAKLIPSRYYWKWKGNKYRIDDLDFPVFEETPYTTEILEKHGIVRGRVKKLYPRTCYVWHVDPHEKVHIPLWCNPHSMFVFEDYSFHLPADGSVYRVKTKTPHTFMNAGDSCRYHIIGQIKGSTDESMREDAIDLDAHGSGE